MRRRAFISLLGGAAMAWPFAVRAQQPPMPVIGFLSSLGRDDRPYLTAAFHGLIDPYHGERLKQPCVLQWPGIDRLEAELPDQLHDDRFFSPASR